MSIEKLRAAVEQGDALRTIQNDRAQRQQALDEESKRKASERRIEQYVMQMKSDDFIYKRVTEARAKNESSFTIRSAHWELAAAIRLIPGFYAEWIDHWDYCNSDEVKEDLSYVLVKWSL